jgi:hypothetical protein
VISSDGQSFTLSSITLTDPSPGSQWAADAACIGSDTPAGQPCLIKISALGPVGQTLTARLVAQDADGIDVLGTPVLLAAVPRAASSSPHPSSSQ